MFSVIILMNLMIRMAILSLKAVITFAVVFSIEHNGHDYQYDNNDCNGDNTSKACNGNIVYNSNYGCNTHK